MTKEEQEKLGLQAAAEVYKQMPVLPDSSPVTQYIQRVGKRLANVIPSDRSWPYQFHVIPQKDINAFALPGGPMFVNVGTVTSAENEAELVGVMAHEMAHVYMQHSAKQASKAQWVGLIGALGGIFGNSPLGTLARTGIQFGAGTVMLKYSRGDESQADAVGAIIMYKANYTPQALADFFEKLQKESGAGGPQFFSDHPNPGNRTAAINKEIATWPPRKFDNDNASFASARQAAGKIEVYTTQQIAEGAKRGTWSQQNKKNGATVRDLGPDVQESQSDPGGTTLTNVGYDQVRPSNAFVELRQNSFRLGYPQNWRASTGEDSATITPEAGATQSAIAYGIVVQSVPANDPDFDQATQSVVSSLERKNAGLRASGRAERISINGAQGRSVYLSGPSPLQRDSGRVPERDWLVTVPRSDGGLVYLVFIAPEDDFPQLRATFQRVLGTLQVR